MLRKILSKSQKITAISVISVLLFLGALNHTSYAGVTPIQNSSEALNGINGSNPVAMKSYLNYSQLMTPASGQFYYFPASAHGDHNVTLALIPIDGRVLAGNTSPPTVNVFESFFGIGYIDGPNSWNSRPVIKINSVEVVGNNSTYNTKVVHVKPYSAGSPDVFLNQPFSPTDAVSSVLLSDTGAYVRTLDPGLYSIEANISVYFVHLIYRNFQTTLNLSMPWLVVLNNYTATSLPYYNSPSQL